MAEILKHALIADSDLFDFLETQSESALTLKPAVIERLVRDSVIIKSRIVGRDEREVGERRKLNFGHTFGHALEKVAGLSHGEAVSVGMVMAAAVSVRCGRLAAAGYDRIIRLLRGLRLPCTAHAPVGRVMDAVLRDKKRTADRIHFVMLEDIGRSVVVEIRLDDLKQAVTDVEHILQTNEGRRAP